MINDVNFPNKWEADYLRKTDGWDLGGATPAFKSLASNGRFKPGRMIVPGAGRGHDAREFARHGFEVTAVDFSPYVINEMKRLADPQAPVEILQHDLFSLPAKWTVPLITRWNTPAFAQSTQSAAPNTPT